MRSVSHPANILPGSRSQQMRAWLAPESSLTIQQLTASFKVRVSLHLRTFQRTLGLMPDPSFVVLLVLLLMQPLQYCLKVTVHAWRLKVIHGCVKALRRTLICTGQVQTWRRVVTTDTSNIGWGALGEGRLTSGSWSILERHINWNSKPSC